MSRFLSVTGTINHIGPMQSCSREWCNCASLISLHTEQGPADLVIFADTYILGCEPLHPGQRITAFYDANAPMPLIYPPRYNILAAARLNPAQTALLAYFDEQLTDEDNTLHLNISRSTKLLNPNGQLYYGPLGKQVLLAVYSSSTRSVPAITTPETVITFCGRPPLENS